MLSTDGPEHRSEIHKPAVKAIHPSFNFSRFHNVVQKKSVFKSAASIETCLTDMHKNETKSRKLPVEK